MEPTLRRSAGAESRPGSTPKEKPCHVPLKKSALADAHAPSITVPLRFLLTGILSLFAGVGFLVARPDLLSEYHYNQHIIAVTHLFVLGFALSIVMGATYQLVPVALETRLYKESLARWHFGAHLIGFAGMVWMFWIWDMKQVGHFASLLALGAGWFVYNIVRTLRSAPRRNVITLGFKSVLFWLSFTLLAGLYLACTKCWSFSPFDSLAAMHAHAHAGVLGIFILLIMTVSFKVLPMFVLGDMQSSRRAAWAIHLVNAGLGGAFLAILFQNPLKPLAGLVIVCGLAVYGWEILAILRARKRRQLDWGLKQFLAGLGLMVPLCGIGLVLSWPTLPLTEWSGQLETVYALLGVVGVTGFAILGMLHKIVPFLVWYRTYSPHIGRVKVPTLGDMYSTRLQAVSFLLLVAGLLGLCGATLLAHPLAIRAAALLLALGLAAFAGNMGLILSHLIRPRLQPGPGRPVPLPSQPCPQQA